MLSFGIQFGNGFDQPTLMKVLQSVPIDYDYDLLVIGSNPGGVACAREARYANKKSAIITWKKYTPAEAEGYDEDLREMELSLDMGTEAPPPVGGEYLKPTPSELKSSMKKPQSNPQVFPFRRKSRAHQSIHKSITNTRRVRRSRLDLKNELFKRGQQCRKLMHNATYLGTLLEDAKNSGWRLGTASPTPLSINWHKLTEGVMDYVMEKNSELITMLNEEEVEVIEGFAAIQNSHTVKLTKADKSEIEITADIICLALPSECVFPRNVLGAKDYGITCDDFIRLELSPGNTLIVGALPESLECAGILAGCRIPATVVTRSKILKGYDSEVVELITRDLRSRGVQFLEDTILKSIEMMSDGKLLAKFSAPRQSQRNIEKPEGERELQFDTVLFAVGRKVLANVFGPGFGVERDERSQKIVVNEVDATSVPNIYAVGDGLANRPEGYATSELAGKLLGKRLFHDETEVLDFSITPNVILTPTEYAHVGISEDAAMERLGSECVDVYYGHFKPLDFVIPAKPGYCFAKVIVLKSTDAIIGVHIFGPEAGEIIQGFAVAIRSGLTRSKFRTVVGVAATKAQEIFNLELKTPPTISMAVQ